MLFGAELCSQTKRSSSRRTMVVLGCIETKPRNSRYDERYVEPTERSGRFSVNVWGWISAVSPGVMLHVEERLNSGVYIRILENVMRPSVLGFIQIKTLSFSRTTAPCIRLTR
jgi:hypothetical protein